LYKDPNAQAEQTEMEELQVPRAVPNKRFARVVRHVLDEQDCAALLADVNAKGFTPALVNVGMGTQQLMPELRDGHRVIVDCPELAAWLLEVLRPYLPEELPNGFRLVGLNERCRFLCYTPGQAFEEHCDGCYRRPKGHPQEGDRSMVTVQLYLHDVPHSHGGATTFFPGMDCAVMHQPEAGSVLLFSQDLPHEGSLVREGLKYTLRTEAMYTSRRDNVPAGFGLAAQQLEERDTYEKMPDLP
jgi:predicted 2-oxoglutarate/Fe(II)-dependent dioxygenase YbiX